MSESLVSRILLTVREKDTQPTKPFVGRVEARVNLDLAPFIISDSRGRGVVVYGAPSAVSVPGVERSGVCSYGIYQISQGADPTAEIVRTICREGALWHWPNVLRGKLTPAKLAAVLAYFEYHGVPVASVSVHPGTLQLMTGRNGARVTAHPFFAPESGRLRLSELCPLGVFVFSAPQDLVGVYHTVGMNAGFMLHNAQRGVFVVGDILPVGAS
jgi:hypothetical protein